MKRKSGRSASVPRTFGYMAALAAVLTVFLGFLSPLRVARFGPSQLGELNRGWTCETVRGTAECTTPVRVDSGGEDVIFRNRIPGDAEEGQALYFETVYQAVEVKIGGEMLYEYGMEHKPSIGKTLGNISVLLPIPQGAQGQEVEILLRSPFHQEKAYLSTVSMGEPGSILLNVLYQELGKVIFVILMYFTAAAILLANWALRRRGTFKISGSRYMSVFMILTATWMLTDSQVIQFLTDRAEAVTALSFSTFMLLPVPLFMLLRSLCVSVDRKSILERFAWGFLIIYGLSLLLYLTGIMDFFYSVRATHLLLAAGIVVGVVSFLRDAREQRNFQQNVALISVTCLSAFGGLALIVFYLRPDYDRTGLFQKGTLLFVLLMMGVIGHKVAAIAEENLRTAYYRDMAYRDPLTRLLNRNGLKAHVMQLFHDPDRRRREVGLLMMDVDFFKRYNDTYGHIAGDRCLAALSRILSGTLRKKNDGACRYGGEEFLVFLYGTDLNGAVKAGERIRSIVESMELAAEDGSPTKVTVSIGIAGGKASTWAEVEQLIGQADRQLYQAKEGGRNRLSY